MCFVTIVYPPIRTGQSSVQRVQCIPGVRVGTAPLQYRRYARHVPVAIALPNGVSSCAVPACLSFPCLCGRGERAIPRPNASQLCFCGMSGMADPNRLCTRPTCSHAVPICPVFRSMIASPWSLCHARKSKCPVSSSRRNSLFPRGPKSPTPGQPTTCGQPWRLTLPGFAPPAPLAWWHRRQCARPVPAAVHRQPSRGLD